MLRSTFREQTSEVHVEYRVSTKEWSIIHPLLYDVVVLRGCLYSQGLL